MCLRLAYFLRKRVKPGEQRCSPRKTLQGPLYRDCQGYVMKTFLYGAAILLAAFLTAGVLFYIWLFYIAVPGRHEVAAEIERAKPEFDVIDVTLQHRPYGRPGDPLRSYLTSFTGNATLREDLISRVRSDVEISELCGHSVSRSGRRPSIYRVSVPAATIKMACWLSAIRTSLRFARSPPASRLVLQTLVRGGAFKAPRLVRQQP